MECSSRCEMSCLPPELWHMIHSYLPLHEQLFTMPQVSHAWKSVSDSRLIDRVKHFLKSRFLEKNDADLVVKIFKENNLFSPYKCFFDPSQSFYFHEKIVSEKEELKEVSFLGSCQRYEGYASYYNINWNPNTLQLSFDNAKIGDMRTSFAIKAIYKKTSYQRKRLFKDVDICVLRGFICEKRTLFSWKRLNENDVQPKNMHNLIYKAFLFQLKMHASYIANWNIHFLSKLTFPASPMIFPCDKKGRILDSASTDLRLIISIEKIHVSDKEIPFLTWKLDKSFLKDKEETDHTLLTDLMLASVLSKTCKKLAKKLGIGLKSAK